MLGHAHRFPALSSRHCVGESNLPLALAPNNPTMLSVLCARCATRCRTRWSGGSRRRAAHPARADLNRRARPSFPPPSPHEVQSPSGRVAQHPRSFPRAHGATHLNDNDTRAPWSAPSRPLGESLAAGRRVRCVPYYASPFVGRRRFSSMHRLAPLHLATLTPRSGGRGARSEQARFQHRPRPL